MAKPKVVALTDNVRTKKLLQKAVTATGCDLALIEHISALDTDCRLLIWDFKAGSAPSADTLSRVSAPIPIVILLEGTEISQVSTLWNDTRCKSVMVYRGEDLDEAELIVTVTKLIKGDIFGLQKYFTWGVTLYSMKIYNYREKVIAIDIIDDAAKQAGCRKPVRQRIALAADELLINALYHSPVDSHGKERYGELVGDDRVAVDLEQPVVVRYATDGQRFAIAVRDSHGTLSKERLLRYLTRSSETKAEMETKKSGAGLGLHEVMRSVSSMAWNLSPGTATEVVCRFDMEVSGGATTTTRSMSIFSEAPRPAAAAAPPTDGPALQRNPMTRVYVAATALLCLLLGLALVAFDLLPRSRHLPVLFRTTLRGAALYVNGQRRESNQTELRVAHGQTATVELRHKGKVLWRLILAPQPRSDKVYIQAEMLPLVPSMPKPAPPPP